MAVIPKKTIERYVKSVPKFQRILNGAKDRDINEADTVAIMQDVLAEVFGFEKYLEITSEYAIRGTYCDLAIKMEDKVQYIIEVKAVGLTLKASHLRQAVNYCVNHGVQWVVLSNGIIWDLYRIRFERPINYDLVSSFNFLDINPRKTEDQQRLFLLSKRGLSKAVREDYYEHSQSVNRFTVGALVISEGIISAIKRNIRKLTPGIKVEDKEIKEILQGEVLKRDVIEGDDASKAINRVRRISRKPAKPPVKLEPKSTEVDKVPSSRDESIKGIGDSEGTVGTLLNK